MGDGEVRRSLNRWDEGGCGSRRNWATSCLSQSGDPDRSVCHRLGKRALVIFPGSDNFALGEIVCNGFGDWASVDGTATDVPISLSSQQKSHKIDTGVIHLETR